jgi:hypothetical protein
MNLFRLLPLFCLACASPVGSEYHRGTTTTRPPPAPARPGVGAPVVGQPGSFTQSPPRSPNTRVLPSSNEPGLWSADAPRASGATESGPVLYGIEMPAPEDVGAVARFHAAMCARTMEDATQAAGKARLIAGLSRQQKACLALQLQLLCLVTVRSELPRAQREARERLSALVDATSLAEEKACMGVAYGKGAMKKAFDDMGERWLYLPDTQKWWRPQ